MVDTLNYGHLHEMIIICISCDYHKMFMYSVVKLTKKINKYMCINDRRTPKQRGINGVKVEQYFSYIDVIFNSKLQGFTSVNEDIFS